ncbi:hypothetical protein [Microvirga subterranea]|uniref:hypothetical protein n=1 Tax=Microvirga subterranea TaxID=186651 RepID=UPI0014728C10|nr:hypothetical protein [Microvirga subterranea]
MSVILRNLKEPNRIAEAIARQSIRAQYRVRIGNSQGCPVGPHLTSFRFRLPFDLVEGFEKTVRIPLEELGPPIQALAPR